MIGKRGRRLVGGGRRGFSLVELIAVTGIFALLSAIVLANNTRFGGSITLEHLAYDVALSVREAQLYGIAVRRTEAGEFSTGYGMHFSLASPNSYILFADTFENGLYDGGELVESTTIRSGYGIADICVSTQAGETCGINTLNVVYKRPEPDACIGTGDVTIGGDGLCTSVRTQARVLLTSPRGDRATIAIESTGQVYVE